MRTAWLSRLLMKVFPPKRKPDFLIGPSNEDPYMRRWWVIPRNKFFNIYLHHMRHDDDDRAPHDHPWPSLSLCLSGTIGEYVKTDDGLRYREITQGQWVYRSSTFAHRLVLPQGEAWTLFMTGPVIRVWGFHCPKGFVPWKDFVDPNDKGKPGRGCGET